MDSVVWIILAAVLGAAEIFTLTAALGLLAVAALAAAGLRHWGSDRSRSSRCSLRCRWPGWW